MSERQRGTNNWQNGATKNVLSSNKQQRNKSPRLKMMKLPMALFVLLDFFHKVSRSDSFQIQPPVGRRGSPRFSLFLSMPETATSLTEQEESSNSNVSPQRSETQQDFEAYSVRAPLKFLGPYPCLGLRFPNLSTATQQSRHESGVTLDFCLDTAANINTIHAQVAQALNLNITGQALPGMSSAGPIPGDNTNTNLPTFSLGDAQLEGLGNAIFMQNLTASALPVASPASAGLLSLAFLQSFEGGVMFDWSGNAQANQPPSITFYGSTSNNATKGLQRVPLTRIPVTQLVTIKVKINGHILPALLDTGSPITVLNSAAARQAGIATVAPLDKDSSVTVAAAAAAAAPLRRRNPLTSFQQRWQQAQAASKGQVLSIMGVNGQRVHLVQSSDPCHVGLPLFVLSNNKDRHSDGDDGDDDDDDDSIDMGTSHVYVGDLPGLAALQGLGVDAPPAVVLGMDFLRNKRYMVFRPLENEVWF